MARATIEAGICGFTTTVDARAATDDPRRVFLNIQSGCQAIQALGENLTEVDPFREFTFRNGNPLTLELAAEHCDHAACPVPAGIIKTVEVAAGLALPANVMITITNVDEA